MEEVGGRLQQTRPLFMQHFGNTSNGNFSCSFPLAEFCWWWDLVFFKLFWSNKYLPQNWNKYPVWLQFLIYIIALWQQFGEDNKWRLLWWLLAMMYKTLPDFLLSTPVTVLLRKWDFQSLSSLGSRQSLFVAHWDTASSVSHGGIKYSQGHPEKHGALSFRFGRVTPPWMLATNTAVERDWPGWKHSFFSLSLSQNNISYWPKELLENMKF